MNLKKGNYYPLGSLSLLFMLFINSYLSAQQTLNCTIGVGVEPKANSVVSQPGLAREQVFAFFSSWRNPANVYISDNKYATTAIEGNKFSRVLRIRNFNAQIPAGSTIQGITLTFYGKSDLSSNIDENVIALTGNGGARKGVNKANTAWLQRPWKSKQDGTDGKWCYGGDSDNWGAQWTAEEINSSDFGVDIQIRNMFSETVQVALNHIDITVHYTPPYSFCDGKCLTFYVDKFRQNTSYVWHIPDEFDIVSTQSDYTIDLNTGNAKFGLYNICVDVYNGNGQKVEQCCRPFLYEPCNNASIIGEVWADLNNNKIKDNADGRLSGIELTLYTLNQEIVQKCTTDVNGKYVFESLEAGNYFIKAPVLSGNSIILKSQTPSTSGSEFTNAYGTGSTDDFELSADQTRPDLDFGYTPLVNIGDYVWEDKNYNGLQDAGEQGIGMTDVHLYNMSGIIAGTMTTDETGKYQFSEFPADAYSLLFIPPVDYIPTHRITVNSEKNSKVDSSGRTSLIAFSNTSFADTMDAGFFKYASVGNFVWDDLNGNGIQDNGEPGIDSLEVLLEGIAGDGSQFSKIIRTQVDGYYLFDSLFPGTYTIKVLLPANYSVSPFRAGIDSTLDNDAEFREIRDAFLAFVPEFTLMSGEQNFTVDIGVYSHSSVGDLIWEDINGNGIFDISEPGIPGVLLEIAGVSGDGMEFTFQTTTDAEGKYTFNQLKPGGYTIKALIPDGYVWVNSGIGADTASDSDFDPSSGEVDVLVISGTRLTDIDGGLIRTASVSGFTWEDLNCDGVKNPEEPPFTDAIIRVVGITNQDEPVNQQLMPTSDGAILVEGLMPGEYTIIFEPSPGFETNFSTEFQYSLLSGNNISGIEIPVIRRGSISGISWDDLNKDGILDAGEPLLGNIRIILSGNACGDDVELITQTDINGVYEFIQLKPGVYTLSFDTPEGYTPTAKNEGNNTLNDSDINVTGDTDPFILISNQNRTGINAGYKRDFIPEKGSIGDFVWEDVNGNGLQESDERGLTNIELLLTGNTSGGVEIERTTFTDENGYYLFDELEAGNYTVSINLPVSYFLTELNLSNTDLNSDFNAVTLKTDEIILGNGENRMDVDAGLFSYAIVGDRVWRDINSNGLQDEDEPGITDLIMVLRDGNSGSALEFSTTDEFGFYWFNKVKPGVYFIEAEEVEGSKITEAFALPEDLNSDFVVQDGRVRTFDFFLRSNDFIIDLDLGLLPDVTGKGGFVWLDADNDGIKSNEELPVSGLQVILNSKQSDFKDTVLTDENGYFFFTELEPGLYSIIFERPGGYNYTLPAQGNNSESDSDVINFMTGETAEFVIEIGDARNDISAGFVLQSIIGDFVWLDNNQNGLQDANENGLNNILVSLFSSEGNLIDSVLTSINASFGKSGYYSFDSLMYGTYYVKFDLPENLDFTIVNETDNLLNSKVNNENGTGTTSVFSVGPGLSRSDIDAGYIIAQVVTGSISGLVWQDANNNLFRDSDELLLSGVQVSLFTTDNELVHTALTGSDGSYVFTDLEFGDYYLSVPSLQDKIFVLKNNGNSEFDSDITNVFGDGTTSLITVFPGQSISNIDFGYAEIITIGDFVWDDMNYNGLQDNGEPGLSDVSVTLLNFQGEESATVLTDSNGFYRFDNIAVGSYSVLFGNKEEYLFTLTDQPGTEKNSKANPDGLAGPFDFTNPGQYDNIDAGYVKTASAGSFVWLDLNGNGFRNANEPGIQGIPVRLFTSEGALVAETTSEVLVAGSNTGNYIFTGLRPGSYHIQFDIPENYIISEPGIGGEDFDSDVTNAFGRGSTDIFSLQPGENRLNLDAGAYLPATLGDFVWNDLNKNGIQDAGEPGIGGIKVDLYASTGQLISSTLTNDQGFYGFTGLRQRLYYIQVELKPGFRFTIKNAGNDGSSDSDVDETGTTPLISLAHGATFLAADAGLYETDENIVMGRIWVDENQDGIRDTAELLLDSVYVHLLNDNMEQVSSGMTNHAGMYCVASQAIGAYYIKVDPKPSHIFTLYGNGSNPALDNDIYEDGMSDMLIFDSIPDLKFVDGGLVFKLLSSLQGVVWSDKNNNGILDTTDQKLTNVPVLIFNKSRMFIKSVSTSSDGSFILNDLEGGEYYCLVPSFPDLEFIFYDPNEDNFDSNITNQFGNGTTRLINLAEGENIEGFNIGYRLREIISERLKNGAGTLSSDKIPPVQLYPNPAFWFINVQNDTGMEAEYWIFDNFGKLMNQYKTDEALHQIPIEKYPPGRYTMLIRNQEGNKVMQFIKLDN